MWNKDAFNDKQLETIPQVDKVFKCVCGDFILVARVLVASISIASPIDEFPSGLLITACTLIV